MLRTLALCLLLPTLTSCFSVGVRVQQFVVITGQSDTAIVLESKETMPVLGLMGLLPPVWIIEAVEDLLLPWYALGSDELDVRWGPLGVLLAQLPGITIIPHSGKPPLRWLNSTRPWHPDEFAQLLAAAQEENNSDRLLELWRRGNNDPSIQVLDVRVVEIRPATAEDKK